EPVTLRFATAAPDGTAWARLFRAMGRDIAADSEGAVTTKWYFGGIAGSELQTLDRLKRNQLDAVMSGGMLCMKLSPSMRVLRLLGLFQSRDEASYVLGRLRTTIDQEFAASGFHNVGEAGLGSDMMFTRAPVNSIADMRKTRFWFWDLDEAMRAQLAALGVPAVGLPVEDAGRAFEDKRVDGFLAVPAAALAYQWSAAVPYLSQLRLGFLPGCMVMTNHAWDGLTVAEREAVTGAAAKFQARLEELGRSQDAELLGTLFARQGLKQTAVSAGFASEFFEAARAARDSVRDKLIPGELIDRVTGWVADLRVEAPRPRSK
ncbi:MAG: TRAP-type C4-dicarboxylate transport system, substrate-binding protein, partial [bacterium]|nr:TRAP-type C4-dicarboxylate transport system, substrate-binding protein [bacterium]